MKEICLWRAEELKLLKAIYVQQQIVRQTLSNSQTAAHRDMLNDACKTSAQQGCLETVGKETHHVASARDLLSDLGQLLVNVTPLFLVCITANILLDSGLQTARSVKNS